MRIFRYLLIGLLLVGVARAARPFFCATAR